MVNPDAAEGASSVPAPRRLRLRPHLPLIGLLAAATVLYVAASAYQWADLDEGLYLGAALAVVHGGVPFVTFAGREPVLIYWLALGIRLFGPSLFVGRLMVDVLFLAAGVGVYATGTRVANRWAGLAAAGVFLFNPLDVYFGSIITAEAAAAAPLAWMLFTVLRRSRPTTFDLFATGLLLGVATLTLRDSIVLGLVVVGLVAWQYRDHLVAGVVRIGAFLAGIFATLGIVLLVFVRLTSFAWMWTEYGPGPSYFSHVIPLSERLGTFAYSAAFEPALLILVALAPGALLVLLGHAWWGRRLGEIAGVVVIVCPWLAVTYFTWGDGDLLFDGVTVLGVLMLFTWFYALRVQNRTLPRSPPGSSVPLLLIFCLVWVALLGLVDGIISQNYFAHRLLELSVPASVVGGVLLARYLAPAPNVTPTEAAAGSAPSGADKTRARARFRGIGVLPVAVVVLLVGSSLFAAVAVLGPSNPYNQSLAFGLPDYNLNQRVYSPNLITQVANYIDATTPANASLFSGDLAFLTSADRANLLNLTIIIDLYDRSATFTHLPLGPSPDDLAPSWSTIFSKWNSTYVPMVVVGARTASLEGNFPYLATYIASRYVLTQTFGNQLAPSAVQIWTLGRPESPGNLTAVANGPGSTISSTTDLPPLGEVAVSGWNTTTIELYTATNLSQCGELTPTGASRGIRSLALDPDTGQLWALPLTRSIVVESLEAGCGGSTALTVPLPDPPTSIAFDPGLHTAIVAIQGLSLVLVLNDSTGGIIANYTVAASPADIAVAPSSHDVYVASGTAPLLAVYNESTGAEVDHFPLGFEANNLLVTSSAVVVTWSVLGIVEWLNLSTGVPIRSTHAGGQLLGFAVGGPLLAVGAYTTGVVTFFDLTNQSYAGTMSTAACPASIAFTSGSSGLLLGGACGTTVELWALRPTVTLEIGAPPSGLGVSVQGLPVLTPAELTVLPGTFAINVTGPGFSPLEFVLSVGRNTTWSPSLGVSVATVELEQEEFVAAVTVAAVGVVLTCLVFPPPPDLPTGSGPPRRSGTP